MIRCVANTIVTALALVIIARVTGVDLLGRLHLAVEYLITRAAG